MATAYKERKIPAPTLNEGDAPFFEGAAAGKLMLKYCNDCKQYQHDNDDERTSIYAQERFAGPFRRVVSLPEDADSTRVNATYRDGCLRVSVHKLESSKPRHIEVH